MPLWLTMSDYINRLHACEIWGTKFRKALEKVKYSQNELIFHAYIQSMFTIVWNYGLHTVFLVANIYGAIAFYSFRLELRHHSNNSLSIRHQIPH